MSYTDKAAAVYEKSKPYLIPALIPFALLYFIEFAKLILSIASALILGFIMLWGACFLVGMYIGIMEKFVRTTSKIGKLTNLRIFKVIVTFGWGYRFGEWLFEELTENDQA